MSSLISAPSLPPRHTRRWIVALTAAVTAAHVWLLMPSNALAPRPPVAWRARWIALPAPSRMPPLIRPATDQPAVAHIPLQTATTPQRAHLSHFSPPDDAALPAPVPPPAALRTPTRDGPRAVSRSPRFLHAQDTVPISAAPVASPFVASDNTSSTTSDDASDTIPKSPATVYPVSDPAPIRLPPAVTLRYQVTGARHGEPVEGESTLIWSPDASSYRAAWDLTSPQWGRRSQTSEGMLQAGGLVPDRYGERQRSEVAAHFDPADSRVRFSVNTPDAPWLPGMQDRLSVLLQLAALLAAAPDRYPAGTAIRLPTVGARGAADALWQVEVEQSLDIAGQPVPCVKLRRDPVGPYDNRTDLWLAREAHYLPARLRITRFNGDTLDQTLRTPP